MLCESLLYTCNIKLISVLNWTFCHCYCNYTNSLARNVGLHLKSTGYFLLFVLYKTVCLAVNILDIFPLMSLLCPLLTMISDVLYQRELTLIEQFLDNARSLHKQC